LSIERVFFNEGKEQRIDKKAHTKIHVSICVPIYC
jgi:hypothetical protein